MTVERRRILAGMACGLLWSALLLGLGGRLLPPVGGAVETAALALVGPGLALIVVIGRIANARFLDDRLIDGARPPAGSRMEIDLRVLANTVEQALLAALVWPALAVLLPPERTGAVLALGLGFVPARLAFWFGYRRSPPARAFGFAATFYPTAFAALWALALIVRS